MGGFGTWDIIERNPRLFAAAIPICGGADTAKGVVAGIKTTPIWTFHGDQDGVVPVLGARQVVAALKSMGSPVIYMEIKGGYHEIWPVVCTTSTLMDWLFSQRLEPTRVAVPFSANGSPRSIAESRPRVLADAAGRAIYFEADQDENVCFTLMESPSGIRFVRYPMMRGPGGERRGRNPWIR